MVKQIKVITVRNSDDEIDRLNFENIKLEKQKSILHKSVKMKHDELLLEKEKNKILSEELNTLKQKLKELKEEKNKVVKKCLGNEDVLKHNLKKQELEIESLHTKFWKKFNLVDKTFFPQNFKLVQLDQPDFNKLWSDAKYSR
ncbi:hypothetical protein Phum_PHUM041380 [Pediculus humanus corporis]|uniref:Uncharacterized protein n=1 Tax=Pediculus humanus subsp. corporis TaxID=121224 RepID=E0VAM9_PEDHC|nr:uncharacterized protein Phum_PHUM041380 [Pediculus humanus corporis]EEB10435.1 hypothetical protein Phum_PHUM041380 [Pediculus humanus corporis]